MKVLLPLVAFLALGVLLQYFNLLRDLYVLIPYTLLGVVGVVGSYVMGQIYRRPLDPRGKAVVITGCDMGYGQHAARTLDALGFTVFAGCLHPPTDYSQSQNDNILLNQSESLIHDQSESSHILNQSKDGNSQEGENSDQSAPVTQSEEKDLNARKLQDQNSNEEAKSKMKFFKLDITSDSAVTDAVNFVSNNLEENRLWAFINCISGTHQQDLIELLQLADYERQLDVDCLGLVRVTRAFMPLVRASHSRIINVLGYQARFSQAGDSAYSMCQHALLAFTDCLRLEMKPFNVKVITVETDDFMVARPEILLHENIQNNDLENELRTSYNQYEKLVLEKTSVEITKNMTRGVDAIVQAVRSCRPRKRYVKIQLRMEMWFFAIAPTKLADWYKTRYRSIYRPRKKSVTQNLHETVKQRKRTNSTRKITNSSAGN